MNTKLISLIPFCLFVINTINSQETTILSLTHVNPNHSMSAYDMGTFIEEDDEISNTLVKPIEHTLDISDEEYAQLTRNSILEERKRNFDKDRTIFLPFMTKFLEENNRYSIHWDAFWLVKDDSGVKAYYSLSNDSIPYGLWRLISILQNVYGAISFTKVQGYELSSYKPQDTGYLVLKIFESLSDGIVRQGIMTSTIPTRKKIINRAVANKNEYFLMRQAYSLPLCYYVYSGKQYPFNFTFKALQLKDKDLIDSSTKHLRGGMLTFLNKEILENGVDEILNKTTRLIDSFIDLKQKSSKVNKQVMDKFSEMQNLINFMFQFLSDDKTIFEDLNVDSSDEVILEIKQNIVEFNILDTYYYPSCKPRILNLLHDFFNKLDKFSYPIKLENKNFNWEILRTLPRLLLKCEEKQRNYLYSFLRDDYIENKEESILWLFLCSIDSLEYLDTVNINYNSFLEKHQIEAIEKISRLASWEYDANIINDLLLRLSMLSNDDESLDIFAYLRFFQVAGEYLPKFSTWITLNYEKLFPTSVKLNSFTSFFQEIRNKYSHINIDFITSNKEFAIDYNALNSFKMMLIKLRFVNEIFPIIAYKSFIIDVDFVHFMEQRLFNKSAENFELADTDNNLYYKKFIKQKIVDSLEFYNIKEKCFVHRYYFRYLDPIEQSLLAKAMSLIYLDSFSSNKITNLIKRVTNDKYFEIEWLLQIFDGVLTSRENEAAKRTKKLTNLFNKFHLSKKKLIKNEILEDEDINEISRRLIESSEFQDCCNENDLSQITHPKCFIRLLDEKQKLKILNFAQKEDSFNHYAYRHGKTCSYLIYSFLINELNEHEIVSLKQYLSFLIFDKNSKTDYLRPDFKDLLESHHVNTKDFKDSKKETESKEDKKTAIEIPEIKILKTSQSMSDKKSYLTESYLEEEDIEKLQIMFDSNIDEKKDKNLSKLSLTFKTRMQKLGSILRGMTELNGISEAHIFDAYSKFLNTFINRLKLEKFNPSFFSIIPSFLESMFFKKIGKTMFSFEEKKVFVNNLLGGILSDLKCIEDYIKLDFTINHATDCTDFGMQNLGYAGFVKRVCDTTIPIVNLQKPFLHILDSRLQKSPSKKLGLEFLIGCLLNKVKILYQVPYFADNIIKFDFIRNYYAHPKPFDEEPLELIREFLPSNLRQKSKLSQFNLPIIVLDERPHIDNGIKRLSQVIIYLSIYLKTKITSSDFFSKT